MTNKPLYSPATIKAMLDKYGFSFSKSLGQNFLIDGNIIRKIVRVADVEDKNVMEIGPGFGVLSKELAETSKKLLLIERDRRLEEILDDVLEGCDNVEMVFEDVLKLDLLNTIRENFGNETVCVVANLPYYVTTPILAHLLEGELPVESITVMVQKEVAKRMVAKPGTKDYGSLSVLIQYYGEAKLEFSVPNSVFMPKPKVESAVVKITLNHRVKDTWFFKVVRAAFGMRRKMLPNALTKALNIEKKEIEKALLDINMPVNVRGEYLSLLQFEALASKLKEADIIGENGYNIIEE